MSTEKKGGARVERARKRLADQGGRRLDLRLSPEANDAAARLSGKSGESITALINRLLIEASHNN